MNLRLLLHSIFFVAEGLLLALLLSAAFRFEVARLLFGTAVAAFCLVVEIFVVVRIARRLWKWSGRLAAVIIRGNPARTISEATAAGTRGEA